MNKNILLRLFFSIWIIFLFHFAPFTATAPRFVYLTMSLAQKTSIRIDALHDKETIFSNGHYYIDTNPGLSFIAMPVWALVYHVIYRWIPETSVMRHEAVHFLLAYFVSFAFTSALFGALTACLMALFIYKRTQKTWRAIFGALLYAFGSIAFFVSTRFIQNGAIAFGSLLIFVLVFEPEIIPLARKIPRLIILGFLMGLAVFIDLSVLPFLLVMGVPILKRTHSLKGLCQIILGASGPVLALGLYLYRAFGNPFLPAQAYMNGANINSICWVTLPNLGLLAGHLIGPRSGLFLYMPYIILSGWYIIRCWNSNELLDKEEKGIIVLVFLAYLIYASCVKSSIFSLFGPRYMLPAVPFLCLLVALYVGRKGSAMVVFLTGLGFLINIGGAQIGIDTGNIIVTFSVFLTRGPWLPILNWVRQNAAQLAGYTPEALTPYGLFLLMFLLLSVIWLPYYFRKKRYVK